MANRREQIKKQKLIDSILSKQSRLPSTVSSDRPPKKPTRIQQEPTEECLTEILYPLTETQTQELIQRRIHVRETMSTQSNRSGTIYVPVVFHNVHQMDGATPLNSYCDYLVGYGVNNYQYTTGNDQEICNQRIDISLEVLNLDYAPAGVQFVLHPDFEEIQTANDPGFDCLCDSICVNASVIAAGQCVEGDYIPGCCENPITDIDLYTHYNKPDVLNIYLSRELMRSTLAGLANGGQNALQIRHGYSPGEMDTNLNSARSYTLQHEMGHIFTLKHTFGSWYNMDNPNFGFELFGQRGLVYGDTIIEGYEGGPFEGISVKDCEINGDFICDTETEPGFNHLYQTFDVQYSDGYSCIYHGYGGSYDRVSGILKIGGYNNIDTWHPSDHPDYCELWGFEDPYGISENCHEWTNYDSDGEFFGTKGLPEDCFNEDQSEFATECHINEYPNLISGINAMRTNTCRFSSWPDSLYYDPNMTWFTEEQYANIRYSAENDYSFIQEFSDRYTPPGCTDSSACNYNSEATTDDGNCWYAEGVCDCNGNIPEGVCNCEGDTSEIICGDVNRDCDCVCFNDIDNDNICDEEDLCIEQGGISQECGCNTPIPNGDCDCNGNTLDECGVCGGDGFQVECWNGDLVCDESECNNIPGDANFSGHLSVADLVIISQQIIQSSDIGLTPEEIYQQYPEMDFSGNGRVSVEDIVQMVQYMLYGSEVTVSSAESQQLQEIQRQLDRLGDDRTTPTQQSEKQILIDKILRKQRNG